MWQAASTLKPYPKLFLDDTAFGRRRRVVQPVTAEHRAVDPAVDELLSMLNVETFNPGSPLPTETWRIFAETAGGEYCAGTDLVPPCF